MGQSRLPKRGGLIRAASQGPKLAGLTGRQRAMLYGFAASTGFRGRECAAVRKCDLSADLNFVQLSGVFCKNGKKSTQPLPPAIRGSLHQYVFGLRENDFLWPGGWRQGESGEWVEHGWIKDRRAGELLRFDAASVGIVIGRKGKEANGGKVLDFHSFRRTYISNLERAGVSSSVKERLSRATAGVIERYNRRELSELTTIVGRMPPLDLSGLM